MSEHKEHKHEHLTSESLSVKLEGSLKARNWIIRGVVIFLILVFLGGIALGANDLLSREGQQPPIADLDETITNPPEGSEEIYAFLSAALDKALAEKPKLTYDTSFNIDAGSAQFILPGGSTTDIEWLKNALKLILPGASGHLHDKYPNGETQYHDSFAALQWGLPFEPEELEDAVCDFIYYRCAACRRGESEPHFQCPGCNAKGTEEKPIFVLDYRPNYTLILYFADDSPLIGEVFRTRAPEEVAAMLEGPLADVAALNGIEYTFSNARIEAAVNRTTGKLHSLAFRRDADVRLELTLDPDFSSLCDTALSIAAAQNVNFRYTWPAASLSAHSRTMAMRENSQLTARIDAPDGQETPVIWASSDPAVCSVDQEGYLKAGREPGEAVITVSFELGGETYTDECVIHVKVPVEKAKLNRRSLKLGAGETRQLTASVTPRRASYKDVAWHSEDPDVAAVDDKGNVTALAPGQTVVYALSVDGYYRASCTVTVSGGAR